MIIHSIMPQNMIFPQEIEQGEYNSINGGITETYTGDDGRKYMRRLISTDPMLYLKADFSPGNITDNTNSK